MYHVIAAPALCTINMASGINIYSELLISRIPVLDINNANWVRSNIERLGAYRIGTYRRRKLHTQLRTREKNAPVEGILIRNAGRIATVWIKERHSSTSKHSGAYFRTRPLLIIKNWNSWYQHASRHVLDKAKCVTLCLKGQCSFRHIGCDSKQMTNKYMNKIGL